MIEEWRTIMDGFYAVSNLGRVRREVGGRSARPGRIRKPVIWGPGYPMVSLSPPSGPKVTAYVHRLVAAAFLGPCPEGMEVNHKNGVKADAALENLEYVTPSQNQFHAYRTGLKFGPRKPANTGEKNARSKLTDGDVRSIRSDVAGGQRRAVVAARFGVSLSCVDSVVQGVRWRHVA